MTTKKELEVILEDTTLTGLRIVLGATGALEAHIAFTRLYELKHGNYSDNSRASLEHMNKYVKHRQKAWLNYAMMHVKNYEEKFQQATD